MAVTTRFLRRRQFLLAGASFCALISTGCGTVFHPERRGQCAGRLDWKIVALDALGLVLFLIPGIIAFAVDFHTGAIYLPPCDVGLSSESDQPLVVRHIRSGKISREQIEAEVGSHVGQPIDLVKSNYTSEPLNSIDEFWQKVRRLTGKLSAGQPSEQG